MASRPHSLAPRGMAARPRLLILRPLKLGDLLTAVPALRGLARAYPHHERILAAPVWLEPLVELIDADGRRALDRVVDVGELERLPPQLHGCELAVNLHGRGPQSHRLLLETRARGFTWFEHPEVPASAGAPAWRPDEHEVVRWCRLLAEHGITAEAAELELRLPRRDGRDRTTTVIHPGASSPARQWPVERFAAVARAERRRGRRVLVTGTPPERRLARRLVDAADLPAEAVLAGRTDLRELTQALASAGRLVCGDTGVAHLAVALGTPSLTLFGPTSPAHWGPPGGDPRHRALWTGGCGDPHARRPDPALLEIGAEEVLTALEELP
jgi:ADP-heptose:LPS heptosyltransferase